MCTMTHSSGTDALCFRRLRSGGTTMCLGGYDPTTNPTGSRSHVTERGAQRVGGTHTTHSHCAYRRYYDDGSRSSRALN